MNRAYSILAVKAVENDKRTLSGMATTPTPDRVGDIVDPLGVKFTNPVPLLWQERPDHRPLRRGGPVLRLQRLRVVGDVDVEQQHSVGIDLRRH